MAMYPIRPHAERVPSLPKPVSLLDAALNANESAVAQALKAGADVNECDALGRTAIGCALGGEQYVTPLPIHYALLVHPSSQSAVRWDEVDVSDASFMLQKRLRVLKMLLEHDELSLHALNAPQRAIRGVTPLGFAAWLNIPAAVRLLLETYPGLVSVDGMDSLGATALMCTSNASLRSCPSRSTPRLSRQSRHTFTLCISYFVD